MVGQYAASIGRFQLMDRRARMVTTTSMLRCRRHLFIPYPLEAKEGSLYDPCGGAALVERQVPAVDLRMVGSILPRMFF